MCPIGMDVILQGELSRRELFDFLNVEYVQNFVQNFCILCRIWIFPDKSVLDNLLTCCVLLAGIFWNLSHACQKYTFSALNSFFRNS